jgi:multidrug efflux system outer membrane protein
MSFDDIKGLADVPSGLPSELLTSRPDIRAAENQLLAANANIGAARAAFFPNISLTGSVGTASTSLGGLFKSGSGAWAFTPSISVPIFTGGSLQAGLAQAEAVQREAVANYEQRIQLAFREVADALSGEATLRTQLAARTAEAAAAQKFLDLSNARFFNGVSSYLEVQVAEIQLFNARVQQVLTGFETVTNRINLYKAVGGGFDASAVQSKNKQPLTIVDINPS